MNNGVAISQLAATTPRIAEVNDAQNSPIFSRTPIPSHHDTHQRYGYFFADGLSLSFAIVSSNASADIVPFRIVNSSTRPWNVLALE